MFSSFKIQICYKFPEFLTLQRLAHKVRGHDFSLAIPNLQISFFDLVCEENNLVFKYLVLLLGLFLPF